VSGRNSGLHRRRYRVRRRCLVRARGEADVDRVEVGSRCSRSEDGARAELSMQPPAYSSRLKPANSVVTDVGLTVIL